MLKEKQQGSCDDLLRMSSINIRNLVFRRMLNISFRLENHRQLSMMR